MYKRLNYLFIIYILTTLCFIGYSSGQITLFYEAYVNSTTTIQIGTLPKLFEDTALNYIYLADSGSGIVKLTTYFQYANSTTSEFIFEQLLTLSEELPSQCLALPSCSALPTNYNEGTEGNWYFELTPISSETNFHIKINILEVTTVVNQYYTPYYFLLMCNVTYVKLYVPANLTYEQISDTTLTFVIEPSVQPTQILEVKAGTNCIERRSLSIFDKPNLEDGGYAISFKFTEVEIKQNYTELIIIGNSPVAGTLTFEVVNLVNSPKYIGLNNAQVAGIIVGSIVGFSVLVGIAIVVILKVRNMYSDNSEREPLANQLFQV